MADTKHNAVTAESLARRAKAHKIKAAEYLASGEKLAAKIHRDCAQILNEEVKIIRAQGKSKPKPTDGV